MVRLARRDIHLVVQLIKPTRASHPPLAILPFSPFLFPLLFTTNNRFYASSFRQPKSSRLLPQPSRTRNIPCFSTPR